MAFWSKRAANNEKRMMFLARGLGAEVVAVLSRRNPGFSTDQKQYVLDQVLDEVCRAVRETAYLAAALPSAPAHDGSRPLTSEEFGDLAARIINAATKNNMPVVDALSATAKALGSMIAFAAARDPHTPAEELVKCMQDAVAEFAREVATDLNRRGS